MEFGDLVKLKIGQFVKYFNNRREEEIAEIVHVDVHDSNYTLRVKDSLHGPWYIGNEDIIKVIGESADVQVKATEYYQGAKDFMKFIEDCRGYNFEDDYKEFFKKNNPDYKRYLELKAIFEGA